MVETIRMMRAMLWKNRVPRGRCYELALGWRKRREKCTMCDQANIPSMETVMTAKTAQSQSEPWSVI